MVISEQRERAPPQRRGRGGGLAYRGAAYFMSVFFFPPSLVCRREGGREGGEERGRRRESYQARMEESELLGSVENVVGSLHAEHAGVVLVPHFVFVRTESPSGPDLERVLEEREGLLQHPVPLETGGGVAVLQSAVIDAHDLVSGRDERSVQGTADGVLHDGGEVHRLVVSGLRHLEHERPVRPRLWLGGRRRAAISELQSREESVSGRNILLGVVREDCAAIEGTVVLGIVQPALQVVRVDAAEADPDDVAGGVSQTVGEVFSADPTEGDVQREGAEEFVVTERGAIGEVDDLVGSIDRDHLGRGWRGGRIREDSKGGGGSLRSCCTESSPEAITERPSSRWLRCRPPEGSGRRHLAPSCSRFCS
jgi:hypothetical protein